MGMLANLVRESCTNPGTGSFELNGSPTGYVPFVQAFGTGGSCFYVARSADLTLTEIGRGTVTAGTPNTLSRDLVIWNSQVLAKNPTKLSFNGALDLYCDGPAERMPALNDDGSLTLTIAGAAPSLVKRASDFLPIFQAGTGSALTTADTIQMSFGFTAVGANLWLVVKAQIDNNDTAGTTQAVSMTVSGPAGSVSGDISAFMGAGGALSASGKTVALLVTSGCVIGTAYTVTVKFRKTNASGTVTPSGIVASGLNF